MLSLLVFRNVAFENNLIHLQKLRIFANNWYPKPPKKQYFLFLMFSFPLQNHCSRKPLLFFPFPWKSYSMIQKTFQFVELYWWSLPLKGWSDGFLFLGQPWKFRGPRITNLRKEIDDSTAIPLFITLFKPLNTGLNPICHLLILLGAHHILHVSRVRIKIPF